MKYVGIYILMAIVHSTFAWADFKIPEMAQKVQDLAQKNPNCTSAVIESLKRESTLTCAAALKPGAKDRKKALQEKCDKLKGELKSAQSSCTSH